MDKWLVRIFGSWILFIFGDPAVLARWIWLKKRLPLVPKNTIRLLDAGCGNGAFSIGAAKQGYQVTSISFDAASVNKAKQRAQAAGVSLDARLGDLRKLDEFHDLKNQFDVIICLEVIEHILNDKKVMQDLAVCLKPGGKLLMTTPNIDYIPINRDDGGPFLTVETGWHVRKGYSESQLRELCQISGLRADQISFCDGFLCQKLDGLFRLLQSTKGLGWIIVLPFRIFPPLFDGLIQKLTQWPDYSICLEAHKPA